MPAKRLIGMITVLGDWAVQSFGFRRHLPLGRPGILAENLDRWGVDEIVLIDIGRTAARLGPNIDLVRDLGRRGLSTPLAYGGGIQSAEQAAEIVAAGAERVCLDTLLDASPSHVDQIAARIGAQAVIAVLTMRFEGDRVQWTHHLDGRIRQLTKIERLIESRSCSEVLIVDVEHEGAEAAFDERLLAIQALGSAPRIAFGGITQSEQIRNIASRRHVVGVAIGNTLSYSEHRVQAIRENLAGAGFREPYWQGLSDGALK